MNLNKRSFYELRGTRCINQNDCEAHHAKEKTPWFSWLPRPRRGDVLLLISLTIGLLAGLYSPAAAQDGQGLSLRLNRNFGFSAGSKMQGTFTLKATVPPGGPADVQRVVFYIDRQVLGEDTQVPFELRFTTDTYPLGEHTLLAVGTTAAGAELRSNEVWVIFVSAEEGWQAGLKIAGPMLAIVFGLLLLSVVASLVGGSKLKRLPPGAARTYGVAGGAICRRCGRPFPRHFFSPNIIFGKLERCPYCGHWAIVAARPLAELRAAEAAEIVDAQAGSLDEVEDESERLRRQLDDSRYRE